MIFPVLLAECRVGGVLLVNLNGAEMVSGYRNMTENKTAPMTMKRNNIIPLLKIQLGGVIKYCDWSSGRISILFCIAIQLVLL